MPRPAHNHLAGAALIVAMFAAWCGVMAWAAWQALIAWVTP